MAVWKAQEEAVVESCSGYRGQAVTVWQDGALARGRGGAQGAQVGAGKGN